MIYLDNNATTRPDHNMLNAAREVAYNYFGNPSSLHSAGNQAKDLLNEAREQVARSIRARPSEIIFTSGGTEANSIALEGLKKFPILCSAIEHSSVFNCSPFNVINVLPDGTLDFDHLESLVSFIASTKVVSVMMVNNETGVILDPHNRLAELKAKYGFILHVDAVQAYGKMPIDVENSSIDLMSISAHKCHGLKGVGALYVNRDLAEIPSKLFNGGSHERGIRPGTENQIGIFSLGYMAEKMATSEFHQAKLEHVQEKRDKLESILSDISQVNGTTEHRVCNTTNLYFPGITDLDLFLELVSQEGVCISGKSACASGMPAPSRVLKAMFKDGEQPSKSVRISLSMYTTDQEVERAAEIIRDCVELSKALEEAYDRQEEEPNEDEKG